MSSSHAFTGRLAGVAWATFFRSRGWSWMQRLVYAYRAPSLFAAELAASSAAACYAVAADERLEATMLDGSTRRTAESFAIFYVSAHGRLRRRDFELVMHHDDWRPADVGLDGDGPVIAVFDACDLTDLQPGWADPWQAAVRPRLRLVLGFASLATVGKAEALRGPEFAERVARGDAVASAWIAAVHQHAAHRRDRPVAIALGSDAVEAEWILAQATLHDLLQLPPLTTTATARARA